MSIARSLVVAAALFSLNSYGVSLDNISTFSINRAAIDLTVRCDNGTTVTEAYYQCATEFVSPKSSAAIVSQPGIGASTAIVQIGYDDRSKLNLTTAFDSATGRTADFILWGQGGILKLGRNAFNVTLKDGKRNVEKGRFNVSVVNGSSFVCQPGFIVSSDMNDCVEQTNICQEFFALVNYCQN